MKSPPPYLVWATFRRLVRRARVTPIRLHELRHTHASLALAAGVDVKVVSDRFGRSTTAITADLYTHVIPAAARAAVEAPTRCHLRCAPGRDREHQQPGRTRAMLLRYSESEFAAIGAAARDTGLTPRGYAAAAALALATGAQPPTTAPWRSVLLELMDARTQVRRLGANVNQAARVLNATGQPPIWLEHVMAIAARAVLRIDDAANAVGDVATHDRTLGRRLGQTPRPHP